MYSHYCYWFIARTLGLSVCSTSMAMDPVQKERCKWSSQHPALHGLMQISPGLILRQCHVEVSSGPCPGRVWAICAPTPRLPHTPPPPQPAVGPLSEGRRCGVLSLIHNSHRRQACLIAPIHHNCRQIAVKGHYWKSPEKKKVGIIIMSSWLQV